MRLYRGLTRPYRPPRQAGGGPLPPGTSFTDCPYTALRYAQGGRGVLLVVDVPEGLSPGRLREELWLGVTAKRFMVWGSFDAFLVAELPAKQLRASIRGPGPAVGARADDEYRAALLKREVQRRLEALRRSAPLRCLAREAASRRTPR